MKALQTKECLLIVGKSSHWKDKGQYAEDLRGRYEAIKPFDWEESHGSGLEDVSRPEWIPLSAVYCVGQANDTGNAAAILHNKFWIFCNRERNDRINPKLVVTGSANGTNNSSRNLENMILLKDGRVKKAYLSEMQNILYLAEPLTWLNTDIDQTFSSARCDWHKYHSIYDAHQAFFRSSLIQKNSQNPAGVAFTVLRRVFQRFLRMQSSRIYGCSTHLFTRFDPSWERIVVDYCNHCGKKASKKCCSANKKTKSKRLCIANITLRESLGVDTTIKSTRRLRYRKKI